MISIIIPIILGIIFYIVVRSAFSAVLECEVSVIFKG